ncbi:hypothetical protein FHR83_009217 [Actinoplanes campanulatus]|uniref:Uncharacterized protein n=1 Tax=Actinoplanes campanulatus TaxID=113559 RepID=A0A7W5ASA8_9ACTN|nr:hypothetical protein [Actinoplanes campanulatus]MBB3101488.1 hypothetical protein [Actinoplanes campanulatus]GID42082.1 hypothetical protein Aca09nite_85880 [Actinoplanes campanulatus]
MFTVLLPSLSPLLNIMAAYGFVFLGRREAAVGWQKLRRTGQVTVPVPPGWRERRPPCPTNVEM